MNQSRGEIIKHCFFVEIAIFLLVISFPYSGSTGIVKLLKRTQRYFVIFHKFRLIIGSAIRNPDTMINESDYCAAAKIV